jgi:hypothetical protein
MTDTMEHRCSQCVTPWGKSNIPCRNDPLSPAERAQAFRVALDIAPGPKKSSRPCKVQDCDRPIKSRGLCFKHWREDQS